MEHQHRPHFRHIQLNTSHASAVYEAGTLCFSSPWQKSLIDAELSNPEQISLGCFVEQKLVAYTLGRILSDEYHILRTAVIPQYRRLGLAHQLLRQALQAASSKGCTSAWLEVRESNRDALYLYLKLGFTINRTRRDYYTNPTENALEMSLRF